MSIHDHTILYSAIDGFIRSNCNFESTPPISAAIDEIGKIGNLNEAFVIPLQRQLFGMDAALRWVLFLSAAAELAEANGDPPIAGEFNVVEALRLIPQVYDIGVQEAVRDFFEEESDGDGDNDGDDDRHAE